MHTAIRMKTRVESAESIVLRFPELRKLIGREVEIMVLIDGELEDSSKPSKAVRNSSHVAGSIILDEEAVKRLFSHRFE